MLVSRVLSAVVGIPLAVILVCKGGLWVTVSLCVLAVLGFHEFGDKARLKQINMIGWLGCIISVSFILFTEARTLPPGTEWHLSPDRYDRTLLGLVFLLVMGSLIVSVFRYHRNQQEPVVANVSATVLGSLYVGVTLSFFVLLRDFHHGAPLVAIPGFSAWPQQLGARLMLLLFCATWATDSGAYFIGKSLGKHKLTPASPNKTVEGTVGGLVAAVLVSVAVGLWFRLPIPLSIPIGVIAGIMGQLGDLCKSIMKRDLGTKDFGALIPGHGGVLDRLDSLMMNVAIVYIYVSFAL
ncbi:MAG: phosphatidate cytidylyltransferase [Armatimonadetes bacterium]|nr:phosphatidate cytidylyltransferase [Armatimonadota bacterium]